MFFISRRVMQGRQGKSLIITGVVLVVIGLAIAIGSYAWASSHGGGHYYITFSPIIIGILAIVRGVSQSRRGGAGTLGGPGQGIPQGGYGSQQQPGYGAQAGGGQAGGAQGYGGQGDTGRGYSGQGDTGQGYGAQGSDAPREYNQPGYGMPRYGAESQANRTQDYRTQPRGAGGGAGQPAGQSARQPESQPMPNWYPDPRDPSLLRWWDGERWTPNVQRR